MEAYHCDKLGCGNKTTRSGFQDGFGSWFLVKDPSGHAPDRHFCSIDHLRDWATGVAEAQRNQDPGWGP